MIESLFISLILTLIIEVLLSILIGLKKKEELEKIILVNCLTNPIVVGITNLIYFSLQSLIIRDIILVVLEIIVVFIEGNLFKQNLTNLKINPYLFSLYLNGFSFVIGLIVSLFW